MSNIILSTDSYKLSMWKQYPPKTQAVFSYIESRGGRYDSTVLFGTQAYVKEYLLKPFTKTDLEEANDIVNAHGEPFNYDGWKYILDKHDGFMPVRIKSAPEGMVIPTRNVMVTIENTDSNVPWLTTHLETGLLRAIWYPTTVATTSREIKKIIARYLNKTGDIAGLSFKLHDFGARGCSSEETAMLGGMSHLVNFMGTDTIAGVVGARRYYNESVAGFSIPAAEHSTITSWGRRNEVDAYRNMLTQFAKPGALVAVVSDSYDIYNAVDKLWGDTLRQEVIDSGAILVVRPDSGNPPEVVLKCLELLKAKFPWKLNSKNFIVFDQVRVIQGDGIDADMVELILKTITDAGFSADNVAFGMGGALLQAPQRDDQKFAMKASSALIDGVWTDVFKDPITDTGKRSKKGRLALVEEHGIGACTIRTVAERETTNWPFKENLLRTVYEDGKLLVDDTFADIRKRADLTYQEIHVPIVDKRIDRKAEAERMAAAYRANAERMKA